MNNHRNKRKRLPNFSNVEKELLIDLAFRYKDTLENKKTDAGSCKDKENAWKAVAVQFNAGSVVQRDWANLRHAYENMKHALKKKVTAAEVQPFKDGGGATSDPEINSSDEKGLSLLVNTVVPLPNGFDSDANHNQDNACAASLEESIQNGNQDSGSTICDLDLNVEIADSCDASYSTNTAAQIPLACNKLSGKGPKWADRWYRNMPSGQSVDLVTDYTNIKKTYYDELIKGLRAEESRKEAEERRKEVEERRRIAEEERKKEAHEATMTLLRAQARYYASLTSKLTEEG